MNGGAQAQDIPGGPEAFRQAAIDATLTRIFDVTVQKAQSRIAWYVARGHARAVGSKSLRITALLFFSVGTLAPILATFLTRFSKTYPDSERLAVLSNFPWVEVGFVFLAVAGAIVVFDQFFGLSASWLRFTQTQIRLEAMLEEFRYAWFGLLAQSGGVFGVTIGVADMVKLAHEFVTKLELLAQEETKEWADEYRAAIDKFDQNPDLKIKLGKQPDQQSQEPAAADGKPDAKTDQAANQTPQTGSGENKPKTVNVRLWIDLTDIEDGSLEVTLDEQPLSDANDGYAEVPLEIDVPHTFFARARSTAGQLVTGTYSITPAAEDESKPLALALSESK